MKLVTWIPVMLLAGCTSYVSHGSWLDSFGRPPQPPVAMSDEEGHATAAKAAALRAQASALRTRLGHETDRRERMRGYRQLEDIGLSLLPLERRLGEAGRSTVTGEVPAAPG
jgi:hypothetical protein